MPNQDGRVAFSLSPVFDSVSAANHIFFYQFIYLKLKLSCKLLFFDEFVQSLLSHLWAIASSYHPELQSIIARIRESCHSVSGPDTTCRKYEPLSSGLNVPAPVLWCVLPPHPDAARLM